MDDPVTLAVSASAAIVVLSIVARIVFSRRAAAADRRRLAARRAALVSLAEGQQELERRAARIIATSSTARIAGLELVRQIEAVFTDGHASPAKAVEALKAIAAEKGANALINLASERTPSGKCQARADAVIVRGPERQMDARSAGSRGSPPP